MKNLVSILGALLLLPSLVFGAVGYDGTDDAHLVNNPNVGCVTAFTWCAWIYTTAWQDNGAVFSYGDGSATVGTGFEIITRDSANIRARFYSGATAVQIDGPGSLATSTWIHMCFRHGGVNHDEWWIDATDGNFDVEDDLIDPTIQTSTDDILSSKQIPNQTRADFNGRKAHEGFWCDDLLSTEIDDLASKVSCPEDVQNADLEYFTTLDAAGSVTDESTNAFTVVEEGNPSTQTGPVSLPCGAAATNNLFVVGSGED